MTSSPDDDSDTKIYVYITYVVSMGLTVHHYKSDELFLDASRDKKEIDSVIRQAFQEASEEISMNPDGSTILETEVPGEYVWFRNADVKAMTVSSVEQ